MAPCDNTFLLINFCTKPQFFEAQAINPEWDTFSYEFICDSKTTDVVIQIHGDTDQKTSRSFTLPPERDISSNQSAFLESFDISPRAAGLIARQAESIKRLETSVSEIKARFHEGPAFNPFKDVTNNGS